MSEYPRTAIVGAGLAGCEAAWQLSTRKCPVVLFEMRPEVMTPAHKTGNLAELVCSNSFKSVEISNAHGLLKAEMEAADSLIIKCAKNASLPAGSALAVDRLHFSEDIERHLSDSEFVEIVNREIHDISQLQQEFSHIIIAAGPLMSNSLASSIDNLLGHDNLFFYDSIAPVIYADSINMESAFKASRYGKGDADYVNCPLNKKEYEDFIDDLRTAKKVPYNEFEQEKHFEGCLPIEVMADRGIDTLAFGPMKPVGLEDPRTEKRPWAVLQLRQENKTGTLFNLVGCQTRMTWPEQERIFRKIPGLEMCEFARMGSMHRNTYINAPSHLNANLEFNKQKGLYLAGQLTGVEGYSESASMGLWAAMNIVSDLRKTAMPEVDPQTMIGGLVNHLVSSSPINFQPMNANFGLITPLNGKKIKNKSERRKIQAQLALERWRRLLEQVNWQQRD
ncbi:methylenetetrahydrofolate--tRNA-(uracil(54)-C(5))-methyltransferase (FADH(2)-oxidizing) TrmFO [bacterium]|nr:methylenetetrahydrofolate--tRNA-(uracil(54)-C(5))-methyltransferase (FADH(2)-oxidizing) TrmFO [bacterium]